jgi:hypothetical protein
METKLPIRVEECHLLIREQYKLQKELVTHLIKLEKDKLFERWRKFKNGALTRKMLIMECTPIKKKVGELLEQDSYTAPELKAARFAKNLLERYDAL